RQFGKYHYGGLARRGLARRSKHQIGIAGQVANSRVDLGERDFHLVIIVLMADFNSWSLHPQFAWKSKTLKVLPYFLSILTNVPTHIVPVHTSGGHWGHYLTTDLQQILRPRTTMPLDRRSWRIGRGEDT